MNTDLETRLARLENRAALEEIIYSYAQAFDRRDSAMLRSIWHEDAILDLGDIGRYEGLETIMTASVELWRTKPHMHHWMSNPLIEIAGDTATAATALDCFVVDLDTGPTQVGGLYRDSFERRDGRWGLVLRQFELHYWTPIKNWVPTAGTDANLEAVAA